MLRRSFGHLMPDRTGCRRWLSRCPSTLSVSLQSHSPCGTMRAAQRVRSAQESGVGRPDDPFSLNLARIVFRLMTSPRGWDVRGLKRELRISDRTYRKYRKTLQDRFVPLFNGKGQTLVREVSEN